MATLACVHADEPWSLKISPRCNRTLAESNYAGAALVQSQDFWTRAAWTIWSEFLRPNIPNHTPRRIVDVGCGFGLYNVHVSRHFAGEPFIVYFDNHRKAPESANGDKGRKTVSGWHNSADKMSFYNNDPSCTREIAEGNGVPHAKIEQLIAVDANLRALSGSVDLIYSHMSWGYHYPVSTYVAAAFMALGPGGTLLLTVRDPDAVAVAQDVGFRCSFVKTSYLHSTTTSPGPQTVAIMRCTKPMPPPRATVKDSTPANPAKKAATLVRKAAPADPVKKAATLVRKALADPAKKAAPAKNATTLVRKAPVDPVKKAATLVRKAAMPQQLIVQIGLKMLCDSKHSAVASSRIMLAAAGVCDATHCQYAARCVPTTAKSGSQVAEVIITFYDRAARSAFYSTLHKLIYKSKDKSADAAAFFPGLPVTTVVLRKNPADPPPGLNRAAKRVLAVGIVIAMLAAIVAFLYYTDRAHLPPGIAKSSFPVKESGQEEAA